MKKWIDLYGYHYYKGSNDLLLEKLKFQYGILLCKKHYIEKKCEDQFMYYDSIRRKDVYKSSVTRKNLTLQYYYYDFNTKLPIEIKEKIHKKYSETFFRNNFIESYEIDLDSLIRDIKLKKIIKKVNQNKTTKNNQ